jgi:predicted ferric reductase
MLKQKSSNPQELATTEWPSILWSLAAGTLFSALILGSLALVVIARLPVGQAVTGWISWVFSANNANVTWHITRSAGWVGYILLWFSTVWGLMLPSKLLNRFLSPTFVVDFHEFISLLSIGFILLHIGILLLDQYLPYSLAQILLPFLSPYRPFWVGIGVLGFYLILLVTITFYLRQRIGQKTFRSIHMLSLVGFLGAVLHAIFTGSDTALLAAQIVYFSTTMVVVFLTAYWLISLSQARRLSKI